MTNSSRPDLQLPDASIIHEDVKRALDEDIGTGDITANLIHHDTHCKGLIICREPAIFCGRAWLDEVFHQLDPETLITWHKQDGDALTTNEALCEISGLARPVLSGERTALNFIQTLSGTATTVHQYAEQLSGLHTRLLDTRKTIPGLRLAQKYAARCGGGRNHRKGLYDGILIKENHIIAAGSIAAAVQQAKQLNNSLQIEVEVETIDETREAIEADADILLLDNFELDQLKEAVQLAHSKCLLEASGGITIDNIRAVAETGVDFISIGALTKNVRAIDFSMRFE